MPLHFSRGHSYFKELLMLVNRAKPQNAPYLRNSGLYSCSPYWRNFTHFKPYNPMKISFYKHARKPAAFACWDESIAHNAEQTSHSGFGIDGKEKLHQSQASALCASTTPMSPLYPLGKQA